MLDLKRILCADMGTSSLKAALIDLDGQVTAFARESYPPDRLIQGQIRSLDWEQALARAVGRIILQEGALSPRAICISGNGPTLVPVGYDGEALMPLHWYDGKVIPGEGRSFFLPHARWFLRHNPEGYEKTRYLFSAQEWLSFRLGADPVTALPSSAYTPYYWDEDQGRELGLEMGKFPPFVKLGSLIGRVSSEGAAWSGLTQGIPIIAGGPDFIMALLGVGAIEPGVVCDRAGTSEGINVCSSAPIQSRELRVLPHWEAGLWNIGGVIPSSGRLFEWYRTFTGQEDRSYEETLRELINPEGTLSPDKSIFFPPAGTYTTICFPAKGMMSRAELGRGVLEALGFMTCGVLGVLQKHGFPVREMRVSGGQGKNPQWNQLKADITGCRLLIPEISDGELAGNAALTALALGEVSTLSQAISRMIRIKRQYIPHELRHSLYAEQYGAYQEQRNKLEALYREQGRIDPYAGV